MVRTLGMEPLVKFARYIIYSGFVENIPYPVSGLVLAPPERCKSTEISKFECLGALYVDKATAYGLAEIIQGLTPKELEIYHHFIIVDLENYMSMGRAVKEQFLAILKQTTAEGIQRYRTGRMHLDLPKRKSFGFLMCTTPEDLGDKRSLFRNLAFLSRPLPFSYDYSLFQRKKILDYIMEEEHSANDKHFVKREEKESVELPHKFSDDLNFYALYLARQAENIAAQRKTVFGKKTDLCGIRAKENLMGFVKSIALYNGRNVVTNTDLEEMLEIYKFMNFEFNNLDKFQESNRKKGYVIAERNGEKKSLRQMR